MPSFSCSSGPSLSWRSATAVAVAVPVGPSVARVALLPCLGRFPMETVVGTNLDYGEDQR